MTRISDVLSKLAWGIAPALLLISGQWLAESLTSISTTVNYSVIRHKVGAIEALHIVLKNNADVAIDDLQLNLQERDLLKFEFDPAHSNQDNSHWKGQLATNASLQILLIYEGIAPPNDELVRQAAMARYQERDKNTGLLAWKKVELVEGDQAALPRTVEYLAWFLAPTLGGALILSILFLIARKRSSAEEPRNGDEFKTKMVDSVSTNSKSQGNSE